MKVSAAPSFKPIKADGTEMKGPPLLKEEGPAVILGWREDQLVIPNSPCLRPFWPTGRNARLKDGSLWVADTGHHRMLAWLDGPDFDNQDADLLIGQPDFFAEGRNAKGPVTAATLNVPTGVTAWGDGLAVADAWNHRILLWFETPAPKINPPTLFLANCKPIPTLPIKGNKINRYKSPLAYGINAIGTQLVVCDSGNRRVMIWDQPHITGQPADFEANRIYRPR